MVETPPTPPPSEAPAPDASPAPVAAIPASGLGGSSGSPGGGGGGGGGGPAPVIGLFGVLLLGGTGVIVTLRNRRLQPEPVAVHTMSPLTPVTPIAPMPVAAVETGPSLAFERLPDHVQKDLLEIGDILRGMEELAG